MKKKVKILMTTDEGEHVEEMTLDPDSEKIEREVEEVISSRGNVVMTRLNNEDLQMIDALVNLDVFSSRSEAVAYFTHIGLEQKKDMTSKVMPFVEQIRKLKEEAKSALKHQS